MRKLFLGAIAGLLITAAIGLLVLASGRMPVEASAAPPAWESRLSKIALDAAIAREAPRRVNPIAVNDAELLAGMKLYRSNCAGCHGDGHGPSDWGAKFYPPVPQFGTRSLGRSDWQIVWITENGLRYSGMGGWKGMMSEEDMWRVASFLSRLDSLPPAVAEAWRNPPRP